MKTIKIFAFSLLIFFLFNYKFVFSQEKSSLLWEISGNGLQQKSYLFGTIHMIPETKFYFPKIYEEKFKECKTLALEIDLNLSILEQISIAQKTIIPDGKEIRDFMSDSLFRNLSNFMVDSLKIKKRRFDTYCRFKPFFLLPVILNEALETQNQKMKVYEQVFTKMAKKNKMKTYGLETIEFQMSLVDNMSISQQINTFIEPEKESYKTLIPDYYRLIDNYLTLDIEKIYHTSIQTDGNTEFETNFLITRNKNWIPKIETIIQQKSCFIAVGAGHLGGENGLISLLRKKGYSIVPIF